MATPLAEPNTTGRHNRTVDNVNGRPTGNISQICEMSPRAIESAVGNLASDKGIGEPIITEFLDGVPGINANTVKQQLANIKSSGEYANIIKATQEEIEREHKEALKALIKAEREQQEAQQRAYEAEQERKVAAR